MIIHNDALTAMSTMDDRSIDACIADPPYGISKGTSLKWAFSSYETVNEQWDQDGIVPPQIWLPEVSRVVKPNGNILVFASVHNLGDALMAAAPYRVAGLITWCKTNSQPNITCRTLQASCEYIVWIVNESPKKAKKWTFNYETAKTFNEGKQLRDFWVLPITKKSEKAHGKHPTQKPLSVLERLVDIFTNENDKVLDMFAGSGTTSVVCHSKNRDSIAVERDWEYCKIIQSRLDSTEKG